MPDPASTEQTQVSDQAARIASNLDRALDKLSSSPSYAKGNHVGWVLDQAKKLLGLPDGPAVLFERAEALETSGLFEGTDWEAPDTLQARFVPMTFEEGDSRLVTLECLSELRMLAVASGTFFHPRLSAEQAEHFLTQVLAFNLQSLFGLSDEASRNRPENIQRMLDNHLQYVAGHIGFENMLDHVVAEVWRLLRQRPIQITNIRQMIDRIAVCLFDPSVGLGTAARGAEQLVSALYGPTQNSREDPGLGVYEERLAGLDDMGLDAEAASFSRAMHDSGLVSPYHAVFLRCALDRDDAELTARCLGLSATGRDCLLCYRGFMMELARYCIYPETSQAVYGLACLLERGILYQGSIAAALWRQMKTPLHADVAALLSGLYGNDREAGAFLMSGIIRALGLPLGLGQGNNPACQSTRALSMWSYTDPAYLLQLLRWASRDNQVVMEFEGESLNSAYLFGGVVSEWNLDLDPLSLVLVPHLDRIYLEMGRRSAGRGEDRARSRGAVADAPQAAAAAATPPRIAAAPTAARPRCQPPAPCRPPPFAGPPGRTSSAPGQPGALQPPWAAKQSGWWGARQVAQKAARARLRRSWQ